MKLSTLAQIARGGMGSVELARAHDGRFAGQVFAIKRLHENIANETQFVEMFIDETWMTASLVSPNVVRVAAWGHDEAGMFLATELVQGVSLMRLIKEARQNQEIFAERTVASICSQICAGLAAAHGLRGPDGALLGLVHRDLTPSNVLVSFKGEVKIVDFGIAKAEQRITHTQTGELKGKPGYMAPEQSRGGKVDARSDLFSFGVLMFELLAGRRPWMSASAFESMLAAASEPTPDLASIRKGCNPLFLQIVNKCLEKKPDDRFASAAEVQALLDQWRREKGFLADDQESLAHFTTRNCGRQLDWFQRAIRGEFVKKAAPTFQELQEQIDEAREKHAPKSGFRSAARPAAGSAALAQMSPDIPVPASASSQSMPLPEPGENDATRVYIPPPPSSRVPASRPPGSAGGPKLAGAAAPASGGHAPRITPPAAGMPLMTRRGTELMPEQDPMSSPASRPGAGSAGAALNAPGPSSTRRGTEIMPESTRSGASPAVVSPSSQRSAPMTPPPPSPAPQRSAPATPPPPAPSASPLPVTKTPTPAVASPMAAAPPSSTPPPASPAVHREGSRARPKQQPSKGASIALVILIPLLAALAIWQFRHRLLEVSGIRPAATSVGASSASAKSSAPVDPAITSGQPGASTPPATGSGAPAP